MNSVVVLYTHYTDAVKIIEDNFNVLEVISNNPDDQHSDLIIASKLEDKKEFEEDLFQYLQSSSPNIIILSNFTRLIEYKMLEEYQGRIINIHDSLLPKHKGMNAIVKTWESDDVNAGYTIHLVDKGVDTGRVLATSSFPINRKGTFADFLQDYLEHYHNTLSDTLDEALELL